MPSPTSSELENLISRLGNVKGSGEGFIAQCPAHADSTASLSLRDGRNGVVLKCWAGCQTKDVLEQIGLSLSDLFPQNPDEPKKLVATYKYYDADGALLFEKLRYNQGGRKTFLQRHMVDDEWVYNLDNVPKVLYNLPAVLHAVATDTKILVVEGEKDADAVIALGFVATTMPGGAGNWLDIHTEALAGGRITVCQDNDEIGHAHAKAVVAALEAAGCQVSLKGPPEGIKDVADMLGQGKTLTDLVVPYEPPFQVFLEKVTALADLNDFSKQMSKVQRIVDGFSDGQVSLGAAPYNWEKWLLENQNDIYDYIIDNLVERSERIIWVAPEGVGKSVMQRQVAICCAAGLHPYTGNHMKPLTTLTVDLENPDRIILRTSRRIMDLARQRTRIKGDNIKAFIKPLPMGVNLFNPQARLAVEKMVQEIQPDILFMGPLYKSFIELAGRSAESMATEIAMWFDYIRTEYGCALWLEQHAPLGDSIAGRDLRPFGSSVWSRWPEAGLALKVDPLNPGQYDVGFFRGSRDERAWPKKMYRGQVGKDMPFMVSEFYSFS